MRVREGTSTCSGGPPLSAALLRVKHSTAVSTTTGRCSVPLITRLNLRGRATRRSMRPTIGAVGCVSGTVVPGGGLLPT